MGWGWGGIGGGGTAMGKGSKFGDVPVLGLQGPFGPACGIPMHTYGRYVHTLVPYCTNQV